MAVRPDIGAVKTGQIQLQTPFFKGLALKTFQNPVEDAMLDVGAKARVDTFPRAELGRQIPLGSAGGEYPTDGVKKGADAFRIRAWPTRGLVLSQTLYRFPFGIRQCMAFHSLLPVKVDAPGVFVSPSCKSFAKNKKN